MVDSTVKQQKIQGDLSQPKQTWNKIIPPQFQELKRFSRLAFGRHLAFAIQDDSIQMAATKQYGWKQSLLNLTKVYIPWTAAENDRRVEFVSSEIDSYVKEYGGYKPLISLTVSGSETAFRNVTLPKLSRKDLNSAIEFEARRQLPFPIDDCHYDYRTTGYIDSTDQPRAKVSLLAATSRLVQEKLEPFERLQLNVSHLYHMRDVVGQLLRKLPKFSDEKGYSLINIEQNRSEISFYKGCNLEFSHIISLGTSFLDDRSDTTVFEYFAESLASEIQNSLDYYAGQFSSNYGSTIYVYGDLAYSDTLVSYLGDRFGFGFERFPTDRLKINYNSKSGVSESFPVCLSAAATALNTTKLPNLLPRLLKEKLRRLAINRYAIAFLVTMTLILGGTYLMLRSDVGTLEKEYANLSRQVESFKNAKLFDTYAVLKRSIAANRQYLDQTRKSPSYLALSLKELSRVTPLSIRLYNLDFRTNIDGENMNIFGIVSSKETPPEIIFAEYVEELINSPFFDGVTVKRHVKKNERGIFELDFQIGMRGII